LFNRIGRVLKRLVIMLTLAVILLPIVHQSSQSEDKTPQSKKKMTVKFVCRGEALSSPFRVPANETSYICLKYPNGTPADGTLDFDLNGFEVPASLYRTTLTRIPGDPDTYDAVLALRSDKPGKFRFNATYTYKAGNGKEFVLTDPEGGSVIELTIQQTSAALVEGQNGEFAITVLGLPFSITPPPGMTPEQYLDMMQYPFFLVSFPGTQPAYDIWSTVDIHNATIAGGQILCSAVVHVPTGTTTAQTPGSITIYLTSGGQQVSTDTATLTLSPAVPQANVDLYQCPESTRENSTPTVRFWFYPASDYGDIQDIALKFTNSSGELVGTQSVLRRAAIRRVFR
jgi:hypothetical protein